MRHAWLILAHNQFPLLKKLLAFLDSDNADIYLHIDAKAGNLDMEDLSAVCSRSQVFFVPRHSIFWGDFSMVEAELELLRASVRRGYDYYHLLSGVDVPIKSLSYIENFFEANSGTNYVNFKKPAIDKRDFWRVRFYYPFQRWNIRQDALRRFLRNASIGVQLLLGVDRTKQYPKELVFQKGAQWFSITHALASCVLTQEREIRSVFPKTYCPDELVMQTVVANSPFLETVPPTAFDDDYRSCCRYLDWRRGNPYVFRDEDFDELLHAPPACLFARKFDYGKYPGIVDRLYEHLQ